LKTILQSKREKMERKPKRRRKRGKDLKIERHLLLYREMMKLRKKLMK
jgi:hypothetical protein